MLAWGVLGMVDKEQCNTETETRAVSLDRLHGTSKQLSDLTFQDKCKNYIVIIRI